MAKKMKTNFDYDMAVIGAGASGLAAALTAACMAPELSVAVFEKKRLKAKNSAQRETEGATSPISDASIWKR